MSSSPWESPTNTPLGTPPSSGLTSNSLLAKGVVAVLAFQWVLSASTSVFGGVMFVSEEESALQLLAAVVTGFSALGLLATYLASMVAWMIWQYRAASNLRAMGRDDLQYSEASHVYWWFVPFANLVAPYRTMKELIRASDTTEEHWMESMEPDWLKLMWGLWIVGSILSNVATRMDLRIGTSSATIGLDLISVLMHAFAYFFFIRFVLEVDRRQEVAVQRGEA